ncbi:MAG: bifunctional riboflavin kinase/FAD synthetase [Romboutsia sp.]|uniref:bifunctional riboflavin kinase/FAD synthetase n=1 Tax=Romboutsia TaxID=1501226 RepID=UPI00216D4CA6|nr:MULTISPECIES: bifunctional riboflavin kinase/FAD synthetase [Romboutsia]MCI9259267.1 bifunctional riboflavin kinase/FAD synthetase [Romboutsia sp.]
MDTITSIEKIEPIKESVVTIGNFDGLHRGHQVLIKKAIEYAKINNMSSVVFTFKNHPANYFRPDSIKNIITNEEKVKILKSMGIDYIINIPFNEYMTKISGHDFVKEILLDTLCAKNIIVGHDFTFARNKEGNIKLLKELSNKYGFSLEIVSPIKLDDIRISSTYIRQLISDGRVEDVSKYLGRNYKLSGEVIYSKQLGRTIGFPTANISINEDMIIPKVGIYATKVYIDEETYYGATNVGYNPTVNGDNLSIETNILEFNDNIYGKVITIEFIERIRDEKKFNGIEELKKQLQKDTRYVYEKYICKREKIMIQ